MEEAEAERLAATLGYGTSATNAERGLISSSNNLAKRRMLLIDAPYQAKVQPSIQQLGSTKDLEKKNNKDCELPMGQGYYQSHFWGMMWVGKATRQRWRTEFLIIKSPKSVAKIKYINTQKYYSKGALVGPSGSIQFCTDTIHIVIPWHKE